MGKANDGTTELAERWPCNLCDRGKTGTFDRRHRFNHLAKDFKIFRFVCTAFGCVFRSSHTGSDSKHRVRYPQHRVEDRVALLDRFYLNFIQHISIDEYRAEVKAATTTGWAFGENLAPLTTCEFWLENKRPTIDSGPHAAVKLPTIPVSKELVAERQNLDSSRCYVCGFEPAHSTKKPTVTHMRVHHFVHLAKDFKIFRYVCRTAGCTFTSSQCGNQSKHRKTFAGHEVEDRLGLVEKYCKKFIDGKSFLEYQAEVHKAGKCGVAFGEDLTTISSNKFWIKVKEDEPPETVKKEDNRADIDTSRCNVCGFVPQHQHRGGTFTHMRTHHGVHLANDFKIFRFICRTRGCDYKNSQSGNQSRHQLRYPDHQIEDRTLFVESVCQKFIDNRSMEEYKSEVEIAATTGAAFGENLALFSANMFWLESNGNLCNQETDHNFKAGDISSFNCT